MKRMLRVVIFMALITLVPIGTFFLLPAKVQYQVTEKYTFSTEQTGQKVKLAVMLPKDNAYQDIENIEIEWDGDIARENYEEIEVVRFESEIDEHKEAILEYDVILTQGKISWEANVRDQDTRPQKDIESNDVLLVTQAEEICGHQSENVAYETFKFTAGYLSWPEGTRLGDSQSALTAYESQIGVCGEFANLMTALNRACDNPTRSISGLSMPMFLPPMLTQESAWMHPGGAHAWVEVFTQKHWTIADPSWASNVPFDRLWFGRSQGQYLSYGETSLHEQIYAEMLAWGGENGTIIGAMSAPVKFVAASEAQDNTSITPIVSVKKVSDARWITAEGLYVVILIAFIVVEKRINKNVDNP